jgi:hypothetical protein
MVELAMDEPPGQLFTRTEYDLLSEWSPDAAETLLFPPA